MGIRDDIRTIAETVDIQEKLGRLLDGGNGVAQKPPLGKVRNIATDGQEKVTTSGDEVEGTDADGSPVLASSIPNSYVITNEFITALTDAYGSYAGIISAYLRDNPQAPNDLATRGSGTGGPGTSRTDAKAQADPGSTDNQTDQDWVTQEAALISGGAGAEQIAEAKKNHYATEPGRYEVSDVHTGEAGPKVTTGHPSTKGGAETPVVVNTPQRIAAVVGVDPNDPSKAMLVRFDGKDTQPSAAESEAAGQGLWEDFIAPIREYYQAGYYWSDNLSAPNKHDGVVPQDAADGWMAYTKLILPGAYPVGFDAAFFTGTVTAAGDDWLIGYKQGPGGVEQQLQIYRTACAGIDPYCPATPPRENYWPMVGLQVLKFTSEGVLHSIFDSEVALSYTVQTAGVLIKSALTGDTYSIDPAVEGGFMLSNVTNPDYFLFYDSTRALRAVQPMSVVNFYTP